MNTFTLTNPVDTYLGPKQSYILTATATSPLSALDNKGNVRTMEFLTADGEISRMPVISPNSLKGITRRTLRDVQFQMLGVSIDDFLERSYKRDASGAIVEDEIVEDDEEATDPKNTKGGKKGKGKKAEPKVDVGVVEIRNTFHLFSSAGGMESGSAGITPIQEAHFRAYWPMLSLLGCTIKQMMAGRFSLNFGVPASTACRHLLPQNVHDQLLDFDPSELLGGQMTSYRHPDDHLVPLSNKKDRNMIITTNHVHAGTKFIMAVTPSYGITNLELSALGLFLSAISYTGKLGGRNSAGFGNLTWQTPDFSEHPELDPKLFIEFVNEHKDVLREAILSPKGVFEATLALPRLGRIGL